MRSSVHENELRSTSLRPQKMSRTICYLEHVGKNVLKIALVLHTGKKILLVWYIGYLKGIEKKCQKMSVALDARLKTVTYLELTIEIRLLIQEIKKPINII